MAVDAIVALSILAMVLTLSFVAMSTANQLASTAMEGRRANLLLRYLVETAQPAPGARSGADDLFHWEVQTAARTELPLPPSARLCDLQARAVSRASGRSYRIAAVSPCRPESGR